YVDLNRNGVWDGAAGGDLLTQHGFPGTGGVAIVLSAPVKRRTFEYDAAGNRTSRTDANGRVTEWDWQFSYDGSGASNYRPSAERWLGVDGATVVETISYVYDTNAG